MNKSYEATNYKQASIELGLVFFVLLFVEFVAPGHLLFASMNPNPFWIPVVLGAAQYGTIVGVLCTCAATFLSHLGGTPEPNGSADFYERFLDFWRDPTLWLVSSIAIGHIRERQINRWNDLRKLYERLELERQEIAAYCAKLEDSYRVLERKIATGQTVDALASALLILRNADRESLDEAFRKFATLLLGPCSYLVCLGRGGAVTEWLTSGDVHKDEPSWTSYKQAFHAIVHERRILSVLDDPTSLKNALFAVPIFDRRMGSVLGLILITAMEPAALSEQHEAALSLLSIELSEALSREDILDCMSLSQ